MWNLNEGERELKPLVFSNGKSQADIVKEVYDAVGEGYKIIFIKGVCGSGKSAVALNLARKFGKEFLRSIFLSKLKQHIEEFEGRADLAAESRLLRRLAVHINGLALWFFGLCLAAFFLLLCRLGFRLESFLLRLVHTDFDYVL